MRRPFLTFFCDATGCTAELATGFYASKVAEAFARARGWTVLGWRFPRAGVKRYHILGTRRARDRHANDVGGGVRKLDICKACAGWTPTEGVPCKTPRARKRKA